MFDLTTYVKKWRIRQLKTVFSTLDTLWTSVHYTYTYWSNFFCTTISTGLVVYIFGPHASNYLSTYKSFDISLGQNRKDVGQTLKTMSHFWHQILATVNFHIFKKTKILKTHLIYRWKHVDSLNAKH